MDSAPANAPFFSRRRFVDVHAEVLFDTPFPQRQHRVDASLQALAVKYATKHVARDYVPYNSLMMLGATSGKRVADEFESAVSDASDPKVDAAYTALQKEVVAQWRALTDAGFVAEPWTQEGDAYQMSSDRMIKDIIENKHLWYFPTDLGFGEDTAASIPKDHPMLRPSGVMINCVEVPLNDIFRVVHDIFGHALSGFSFSAQGEYNAFVSHARMFTEAARPALTAETLFQNAWVNFGPHLRRADGSLPGLRDADWVAPRNRPFAQQKTFAPDSDFLRSLTMAAPFPDDTEDVYPDGIIHAAWAVDTIDGVHKIDLYANARTTGDVEHKGDIFVRFATDERPHHHIKQVWVKPPFYASKSLVTWFLQYTIMDVDRRKSKNVQMPWAADVSTPRPKFTVSCYKAAFARAGYGKITLSNAEPVALEKYNTGDYHVNWTADLRVEPQTHALVCEYIDCQAPISTIADSGAGACPCGKTYCSKECQVRDWTIGHQLEFHA